jgi:hypothetical protein
MTMQRKLVFAAGALGMMLGAAPAAAQSGMYPGTQNVNDCTLLRDPDQTRRCIEAYQGAPPVPHTSPMPSSPLLLPTTPSSPAPATPQTAPPPRLAPR